MKTGHKIIVLSFFSGLCVWVLDAVLDYYVFYQGQFLELLVTAIPSHEIYIRSVILAVFVGFGMIVSSMVTKRENVQESLRESEERFRQIAENISKMLWMSDPDRNSFLYLSPRCEDILGIPPATLYETPRRFVDMIHPEDRQRVLAAKPAMTQGKYDEEFRIVRPDGQLRYLWDRAFPVRDRQDHVHRIVGITEDITERRQAQEALRQARDGLELRIQERTGELITANRALISEIAERKRAEKALIEHARLMDAFFKHSITPLVFLDQQFNFIRVNEAYAKACERNAEEFVGHNHFEFYPSDIEPIFQQVVVTKVPFEVTARPFEFPDHPEWGVTYWDWTLVPILDDRAEVDFLVFSLKDVTERQRAEDALRKSEEKYRELVENANSIIMRVNAEGKITFFNEFAQRFFGYTADELLGREVIGTIAPAMDSSGTEFSHVFQDILKNPERYAYHESENVRRSGDRVWVAWTNKAILSQDGELCGILSIGNDITDRKRAEELLWLDEARFMILLELSQMRDASTQEIAEFALEQAVKLTSSKIGFIGFMNEDETLFTVHARSKSVMAECTIPEESPHFPVEGAGLWAEAIRKRNVLVVNDYSDHTPEHRGYPPGHAFLSRLMVVPVFDRDRIVAVAAVANKDKEYDPSDARQLALLLDGMWKRVQHNVSEEALRQSEEHLRDSNAMLQKVFDGISDPLIMLDDKLLLKMLNKAAREYYGLANDNDAFGRPCFEALRDKPSPCADCQYPFAVTDGQTAIFERKSPLDPNRFEQVVVYPVVNGTGERDATIIRISDITRAKLMERQLVQSEKLASLGLLVSGVAHEINNPNSFISFNVPILRDYLQELMPIVDGYAEEHPDFEVFRMKYEEFRLDLFKLLDNMEHGSKRIDRIVSDLREYARKRDRSELRWIELKAVIEKAVNICHAEIRKTIKSFEVEVPQDAPAIFSDPEAIEQVLVNLLINAVHASDKRDSWIRVHVGCGQSRERHCFIEVSDNGCGIDEKIRDKIFDPFFTTKASSSGTGLGLYVCYNLVDALGGKIEVDSEPGKGSTFRIVLQNIEPSAQKRDTLA
jgi:PAS domain S-box-containing protein